MRYQISKLDRKQLEFNFRTYPNITEEVQLYIMLSISYTTNGKQGEEMKTF